MDKVIETTLFILILGTATEFKRFSKDPMIQKLQSAGNEEKFKDNSEKFVGTWKFQGSTPLCYTCNTFPDFYSGFLMCHKLEPYQYQYFNLNDTLGAVECRGSDFKVNEYRLPPNNPLEGPHILQLIEDHDVFGNAVKDMMGEIKNSTMPFRAGIKAIQDDAKRILFYGSLKMDGFYATRLEA